MPDITANALLPSDAVIEDPWRVLRIIVGWLVRSIEDEAEADGLKYRKQDFRLTSGSFAGSPSLTLSVPAAPAPRDAWVRFGDSEPIKVKNDVVLSTPPEVAEVEGIDRNALRRLSALPDASLTLSGRFNSAAEAECDQLKAAIRDAYARTADCFSRAELHDLLKELAELAGED